MLYAVCLEGPTGTGKTELAIGLAARGPFEIISVDSAMVYRHMDIGTAKPDAAIRAVTPHHLIDVAEPWETYSAGRFRADALRLIHDISDRGNVPLLVGGTMLYFHVLRRGLARLPTGDVTLRRALDEQARQHGWPALHAELARVDPAAAARIEPADRQRIQRALEVYRLTGVPLSLLQQATTAAAENIRYVRIVLMPADRAQLYRHLDQRLQDMIRRGFLDEVSALMAMPAMSLQCAAMRAVGYRQLWQHLTGETDLTTAICNARIASHRLAKRQITWLRPQTPDLVVDPLAEDIPARVMGVLAQLGVVAS